MWFLLQVSLAVCPEAPVSTVTCGSSVAGQLDPGTWTGNTPPNSCDAGFDHLDSSLGASDCAAAIPGFCNLAGWACATGPSYSCGSVPTGGEGPEDVYEVVCPQAGSFTVAMSGLDCDLDLYVLPDTCSVAACTFGSTTSGVVDEGGAVPCVPGNTYYIVVEGFGFTRDGNYVGGADYCQTHTATPLGNYTLDITCTPDTDPEDCSTLGDEDGDGFADCADSDCFTEPDCCDDDGDGFEDIACPGGGDCDDTVANVPGDDADNDGVIDSCDVCPGFEDPDQTDSDGDGYGDACDLCPGVDDWSDGDSDGVVCFLDCDDNDANNFPGNPEQCDLADNDCDGTIDEDVVTTDYWPDLDDDGYGDPDGAVTAMCSGAPPHSSAVDTDCDDTSASTNPVAPELADGQDNDCDGTVDEATERSDDDGDGFTELGGDCDDTNPLISPATAETCDGVDQDCDGVLDNGTSCADDDGDGYCEGPLCTSGLPGDCHDGDPAINPAATEIPGNGIDDDCDGEVGVAATDADGDGIAIEGGDCDDTDPDVHPGAVEVQDGVDNDCDGDTDEDSLVSDDDGDGASETGGDCDDDDPLISPAADELENGIDDDCDGTIDEGTASGDDDGDGFTENGGDCDDDDDDRNPGAREVANGIDDDCDGEIDEGLADRDRDGFTTDDCNDDDGFVNPGATEICDLVDNDCDGTVDEGCDDEVPAPTPPDSKSCGTIKPFHLRWWRR